MLLPSLIFPSDGMSHFPHRRLLNLLLSTYLRASVAFALHFKRWRESVSFHLRLTHSPKKRMRQILAKFHLATSPTLLQNRFQRTTFCWRVSHAKRSRLQGDDRDLTTHAARFSSIIKGVVNREGIRKMTPREWARLQGFPDKFRIIVSDAQAYKQFGNSVAVPAIQATGRVILDMLNL